MKNVRELKSQLRAKYKKIRKSCPPEKKQQLDLALQNAFLASEEYKSCDVLFAFVSSPIEVDTSLILETTLKDGKRLALPKCKNNFAFHIYTLLFSAVFLTHFLLLSATHIALGAWSEQA